MADQKFAREGFLQKDKIERILGVLKENCVMRPFEHLEEI